MSHVQAASKSLTRPFFITTPIFYASGPPHIGHLYTAVLADAQQRYQKLLGRETFFATGTDEHGLKIQNAAKAAALEPAAFTEGTAKKYKDLFSATSVEFDDFIRTSETRHAVKVGEIWRRLEERGHLRKDKYSGWYCTSDETFVTEKQVEEVTRKDGSKAKVSTESGHPVEWTEEETYVFDLSSFQERIKNWLDDNDVIRPRQFRPHVDIFLGSRGLRDLSVSRPSSRVNWGISVPGDPSQTVYVWLDALVNYLTVCPEGHWPPQVQVIGKDILKFHAVYWPAFLMAADLPLPERLLCHSHWTADDVKMSKSYGNVVCPQSLIDEGLPSEGLRYFLLKQGVPHTDCNYSHKKMINYVNSELCNTMGNLLSRSCANKINQDGIFPGAETVEECAGARGKDLLESLRALPSEVGPCYDEFNFYDGIRLVMDNLREANGYFDECKPWTLKDASDLDKKRAVIHVALDSLRVAGILLQPIVPKLSEDLLTRLNVKGRLWKDVESSDCGQAINWPQDNRPFFPRQK